jgi:hypothetical protein
VKPKNQSLMERAIGLSKVLDVPTSVVVAVEVEEPPEEVQLPVSHENCIIESLFTLLMELDG